MRRRSTFTPTVLTTAAVLGILVAIESRAAGDPALVAFDLALARLGREARAAGDTAAVATLMREVAAADPDRAATRSATLRSAWTNADAFPGDIPIKRAA